MQSIESEAFVINMTPFGESHKILLAATPEKGPIRAVARHGRKSLKRFPGALDYFKLIRINVSKKSKHDELWQLNRAGIIHYYEDIVSHFPRYLAGCWLIETYRIFVPREMEDPLYFDWLKDSFRYYEVRDPCPASIITSFIRLFKITGNLPSFDRCVICGLEAPEGASAYYNVQSGGIICRKCGGKKNLLPSRLRQFLILSTRMESIFELDSTPKDLIAAASDKKRFLFRLIDDLGLLVSDRKNFSAGLLFKILMG